VVGDVLGAPERACLREPRRTTRDERRSLVVAEARENRILAREVMVQANVERVFVESPPGTLEKWLRPTR